MEFVLALLALIGFTVLLLVLAVLGLGWLLNRSRRGSSSGAMAEELLQRLERLEARLERLEGLEGLGQTERLERLDQTEPAQLRELEARQRAETGVGSAGVRPPRLPPLASPTSSAPPPSPEPAPQGRSLATRLEQGIENWTGRLGAAAVV
ncbi:MAG: hypothetical protein NTW83_12590, partial [Cyanobacteria bacterium]|nr:hypothetical protein [Cyanobacteriota bacterium]